MTDPGPTGPQGPIEPSEPTAPVTPYVAIQRADRHGSDLIHVSGLVDGVPVAVYLRTSLFVGTKGQQRRMAARALRAAKPRPPTPGPDILGREDL
jgi:hypothetical protein